MTRPKIDTRDLDPVTCPFRDMTVSDGVLAMALRDNLELRHEQVWAELERNGVATIGIRSYQNALRDLALFMVCGVDPILGIGDPRRNLCDPFDSRPLYRLQSEAANDPGVFNRPATLSRILGGF